MAIANNKYWDYTSLISPLQALIPPPNFLPDDVPFKEGKELAVDIAINNQGTHDMYIDNLIGLSINLPNTNNIERAEQAPLLAIHVCSCPTNEIDTILCHPMVSNKKLKAEAALSELKTILGWEWDFRRLIISLPSNKFIAWSKLISDTISSGSVTSKEFKPTIG